MNFKIEEILKKIAKDNFITFEEVKDIYMSEFECAREIMKEGNRNEVESFRNINFIKLGKLYVKEGVIKRFKEKSDERNKKDSNL